MKKLYILLFSFFMVFVTSAQENLFSNPGFEEYLSCYNTTSKDSSRIVKDWSNPIIHAEFPIVDYEFAIFNRWGSQVFFSKNRDETWDATFKNKPLESGVYIWYLTAKGNINGKIVKEMEGGNITLIR